MKISSVCQSIVGSIFLGLLIYGFIIETKQTFEFCLGFIGLVLFILLYLGMCGEFDTRNKNYSMVLCYDNGYDSTGALIRVRKNIYGSGKDKENAKDTAFKKYEKDYPQMRIVDVIEV